MKKAEWRADSFIRTGLRHLEKSQPCQDYVVVDGVRGAALCDGVSRSIESEKASEIGAKQTIAVCRSIIGDKLLLKDLVSDTKRSKAACDAVAQEISKRIKTKLSAYPNADSTLAFVYRLDDRYAILGYIGDSAVIVISDAKAEVYTQTRDYGGPVEGIAHPRSSELLDIRIVDMKEENVRAFVLTSDGLEEELYTKGNKARILKPCEKYVNALFCTNGHALTEHLLDDVTSDAIFDDDISLAILACQEVSLPEEPQWLCSCGHRNPLISTYCEDCDKDYFTLYRHADMSGFPSPWEYFAYLNAHPEEEQRVIGSRSKDRQESRVSNLRVEASSDHDREESFRCRNESKTNRAETDRHNEKPSRVRKGEEVSPMKIPKRFAIIGSAVAVLLCGILAVNFFQILSISNNLESMREEIDSMKNGDLLQKENEDSAAESVATPSEARPRTNRRSTVIVTDEAAQPTQTPSEDKTENISVSVTGTTSLYSEPDYAEEVVGYAVADEAITVIRQEMIDDVEWAKVITEGEVAGWAPMSFFIKDAAQS